MVYSDNEIVKAIEAESNDLDNCFAYLYKTTYKKALNFFKNKDLVEDEIKDLFQDSLIVFYETVKEGNYRASAKISTYLFSIMNNMWINKLRKKKPAPLNEEMKNIKTPDENMEENIMDEEKTKRVRYFMNKLQDDCQRILVFFYYQHLSMKKIAFEMGYKNEQIARNRKSLCMKSLQEIILKSRYITDLK